MPTGGGQQPITLGNTGLNGFYRLKHDPGGRRPSVLMALQLAPNVSAGSTAGLQQSAASIRFRILRPATGKGSRPMDNHELQHRWVCQHGRREEKTM